MGNKYLNHVQYRWRINKETVDWESMKEKLISGIPLSIFIALNTVLSFCLHKTYVKEYVMPDLVLNSQLRLSCFLIT